MLYKMLLFTWVSLALACTQGGVILPAATELTTSSYYVSEKGNDANEGSVAKPFQTIRFALSKARPGDTVLVRSGFYHEKISFPRSGINDRYITLKAFKGEKPVIDGTGLTVTGKEALVTIRKVNYVILDGFGITNLKSTAPWVDVNGIIVDEGASNIIIRNNHISEIEHNVAAADGRSGHAIEIRGNTDVPVKNILVEQNEIHDCNTGYSENLTINGYVDGFVIRKNKIYNGENIGIVAAGGYAANPVKAFNFARNGIITDNVVYNIDGTTGPIPAYSEHNGAIGIYVDGARQIIVERNQVFACGRGIGIVSETNDFPTSGCIVRSNFVYRNSLGGIYLGGYIGYTGGGTRNCYVVNNTTFFNSRDLGYAGEVEGELRITADCHDNVIKNNILVASPDRAVFINKQSTDGSGNVVDFNLYYCTAPGTWRWNDVPYSDFAKWQAACQGDASAISGADPRLVNTTKPDLHLLPGSPALRAGTMLSGDILGKTDIDGDPISGSSKIDIGADQR
jgi:hypothetical protein